MKPGQSKELFEFGPFRLDAGRRLLLRDGAPVALTAKGFEMLLFFVMRSGDVLDKSVLMEALWPDSYVEEANLAQNVSTLRKTLGETRGEHRYIVTIPGRGYQFVAPVRLVREADAESVEVPATVTAPVSAPRVRTPLRAGVVGIGVVVLAALGLWALLPSGKKPDAFGQVRLSRLTTSGRVASASISPDGRFLVYAVDDAGRQGLWVRQIVSGSDVQVDAPGDFGYTGLTFSRDGDFVYAVRSSTNNPGSLVRLPMLGGAPTELQHDVDSPVGLAPDESKIAYVRGYPERRSIALLTANADGTGEAQLAEIPYSISFFVAPAWSPDGERIAWVASPPEQGGAARLATIRVRDGAVETLATPAWRQIGRLAWLPDGAGLVVTASEDEAPAGAQLWFVAYPSGETRRITNDLEDYRNVSMTADGRTLVAIQASQQASLWAVSPSAPQQASRITTSNSDGLGGVVWMPDGRLVFTSRTGESEHLWIADADGSNRRQITDGRGSDTHPAVSPDGRTIAFVSSREGARSVWKTDLDGGHAVRLTTGLADSSPDFSPDGRWIFYISRASGRPNVARVPADGGDAIELTDRIAVGPSVSPVDGRLAAYFRFETLGPYHLVLLSPEGGMPAADFGALPFGATPRWTVDGSGVSYVQHGAASNVFLQPIDGGPPKPVTDFDVDRIFSFAWSRDGKVLACARGTRTRDAVLIRRE